MIRLYTDFVALYEDEKVKQETVTLAEKLLSDTQAQVEKARWRQVELTRANAQVFSTRQDLINARGLREEQEAILKNVLTRAQRRSRGARRARHSHRYAGHPRPGRDPPHPGPDRRRARQPSRTWARRGCRWRIPRSACEGIAQRHPARSGPGRRHAEQRSGRRCQSGCFHNAYPGYCRRLRQRPGQIFARNYPTYGVGVQVTLPIHNRIAEADLARDEIQVKQSQIRVRQLQNQARLEVEDALIAMRRARASYEAATEARKFQQESLDRRAGQVRSGRLHGILRDPVREPAGAGQIHRGRRPELLREGRAALQRATGTILDENHISFDAAVQGKM